MRLIVCGIGGRMGRRISAIAISEGIEVVGVERPEHEVAKQGIMYVDNNEIVVHSFPDIPEGDVGVDFTSPESTPEIVKVFSERGIPIVVGTTGLSEGDLEILKEASKKIPLLYSPNMSVGVNILFHIVENVSAILKNGWDVEITEVHHRGKKDSPSGTAVKLGEIVRRARNLEETVFVFRGKGITGPRDEREIGFQVVRGGDVVGEHTVFFIGNGERLELTHRAWNRDCFARGAVDVAKWLLTKGPGFYSMKDFLGL